MTHHGNLGATTIEADAPSQISPPRARDGTPARTLMPHEEWDRAPWNRYTFQHVREFVSTVPVRRGDWVAPLPISLTNLGAIEFESNGVRQSVAEFLRTSDTDGLLVLYRGAIVAEHYANGMTPITSHLSQSMSKSMVAALAGILADRGLLDIAAAVTDYLPELAATAYRDATVQHLLDMTSGVRWDETYTTPDSDCAKMDAASGWKSRKNDSWPRCMWPGGVGARVVGIPRTLSCGLDRRLDSACHFASGRGTRCGNADSADALRPGGGTSRLRDCDGSVRRGDLCIYKGAQSAGAAACGHLEHRQVLPLPVFSFGPIPYLCGLLSRFHIESFS